jgi:hypothetical protein
MMSVAGSTPTPRRPLQVHLLSRHLGPGRAYDLRTDSLEQHNLIEVPLFQERIRAMRDRLFDRLQTTGGMQVPIRRGDWQAAERKTRQ